MPQLVKKKKMCNPDAYLDEEDLKAIAESEEDIKAGRVFTHEEMRIRYGLRWGILFSWSGKADKEFRALLQV